MTSDPRTASQPTLPAPGGADLLGELITVLADALGVKAEAIDPEQPFQLLGIDSMLTIELVAVVNARYGTRIKVTALYDHPTPAAFARHVATQLGVLGPQPAPVPAPVAVPDPTPMAAVGSDQVVDVLRKELAQILCCDPWDLDADAAFQLLGIDSILGAEFVAVVNRTYGLDERAVTLYDHPSLNAMAAYVASRTDLPAPRTLPGPALRSRTQTQSGDTGSADLEALLDAVRDNLLSVDEAAALLATRAA